MKTTYGILGSGAVSLGLIFGGIGGEINTFLAVCSSAITVLLGLVSVADSLVNVIIKWQNHRNKNDENDKQDDINTGHSDN